jgi:hypothetical protein
MTTNTYIPNNAKRRADMVLPLMALAMSAFTLTSTLDLSNIPSLIVSLIGLAAGIAYFLRNRMSITLLQIWIYAQIPAIARTFDSTLANGQTVQIKQAILDAGQSLTFDLGLTLGGLQLQVNIVPFALLILFRLTQVSSLVGGTATIKKLREYSHLPETAPVTGTVLKRATLGKEKHWLLVQLHGEIPHHGKAYSHLLVTAKDDEIYKRGKPGKPSYLVMVPDPAQVHDGVNRKEDFLFGGQGMVSIGK